MAVPTTRQQFKEYCLRNKYSNWYFNLIDRAIERNWSRSSVEFYVEGHHYIPRALGGTDEHIVYLTSREHFICHILLTKILQGSDKSKMVWAVMCLKGKNRYINSRLYDHIKKHIKHTDEAKLKMSLSRKGTQSGKNNNNYGKRGQLSSLYGTKQSDDHKHKRLLKLRGRSQSAEARLKMSQNRPRGPSGKRWFNDGLIETFDLPDNKPENFNFGRLKRI